MSSDYEYEYGTDYQYIYDAAHDQDYVAGYQPGVAMEFQEISQNVSAIPSESSSTTLHYSTITIFCVTFVLCCFAIAFFLATSGDEDLLAQTDLDSDSGGGLGGGGGGGGGYPPARPNPLPVVTLASTTGQHVSIETPGPHGEPTDSTPFETPAYPSTAPPVPHVSTTEATPSTGPPAPSGTTTRATPSTMTPVSRTTTTSASSRTPAPRPLPMTTRATATTTTSTPRATTTRTTERTATSTPRATTTRATERTTTSTPRTTTTSTTARTTTSTPTTRTTARTTTSTPTTRMTVRATTSTPRATTTRMTEITTTTTPRATTTRVTERTTTSTPRATTTRATARTTTSTPRATTTRATETTTSTPRATTTRATSSTPPPTKRSTPSRPAPTTTPVVTTSDTKGTTTTRLPGPSGLPKEMAAMLTHRSRDPIPAMVAAFQMEAKMFNAVAQRMPSSAYICTVSQPVRQGTHYLPPDGMCDFMFYDSLYKNGTNNLLTGINALNQDVQYFIEQASRYSKTGFGLSFAAEPVLLKSDYKNRQFHAVIDALWNKRVRHFGFLDLYREYTDHAVVTAALTVLMTLHVHLTPRISVTTPSYYVIGMSLDNPDNSQILSLMKSVFTPSMFISIAHLSYPVREFADCRVFPVAMAFLPPGLRRGKDYTYGHTVNESVAVLHAMDKMGFSIPLAISFSLKGVYYAPKNAHPYTAFSSEYLLFKPCVNFKTAPYEDPKELCGKSAWLPDELIALPEVIYNVDELRTMTYLPEKMIATLACEPKQFYLNLDFGLAAYDVDYDQAAPCRRLGFALLGTSYTRVTNMRVLMKFLKDSYDDPSKNLLCHLLFDSFDR